MAAAETATAIPKAMAAASTVVQLEVLLGMSATGSSRGGDWQGRYPQQLALLVLVLLVCWQHHQSQASGKQYSNPCRTNSSNSSSSPSASSRSASSRRHT